MQSAVDKKTQIASTLQLDSPSGFWKKKKLIWAILLLGVVIIICMVMFGHDGVQTVQYKTQSVERRDLVVLVTATGTLEPTNEVEVGSELSGIIKKVNVDFNDRVTIGQVLVQLDKSKLEAQVAQTKASLESAKAKAMQAKATIEETESKLRQLESVRKLSDGKVPAQVDLDAAEAAYSRAVADEASAKAVIAEVQAGLNIDETDLSKTVICSPVNGVVLSRNIEVGQTVAASFEAPVLFTLAEDLSKMELHVDVDEADIGQVKEGQLATFTVDAYQNRNFSAEITQVRYSSDTVDGVVTYETVLTVDNNDLCLRPGMTATADIIVEKVENKIAVPSAALRFSPPEQAKKESSVSIVNSILPRPPQETKHQETNGKGAQKVWVLQDGVPVSVSVQVGVTDGVYTEIISGQIDAGMSVITEVVLTGK